MSDYTRVFVICSCLTALANCAYGELAGSYVIAPGATVLRCTHYQGFPGENRNRCPGDSVGYTIGHQLNIDGNVTFSREQEQIRFDATITELWSPQAELIVNPDFARARDWQVHQVHGYETEVANRFSGFAAPQYFYSWDIVEHPNGLLTLSGHADWGGGRFDVTFYENIELIPIPEPSFEAMLAPVLFGASICRRRRIIR